MLRLLLPAPFPRTPRPLERGRPEAERTSERAREREGRCRSRTADVGRTVGRTADGRTDGFARDPIPVEGRSRIIISFHYNIHFMNTPTIAGQMALKYALVI